MADKTSVCYKYKHHFDNHSEQGKNDYQKLMEFHKKSNVAADVFVDFFLNLYGGITPKHLVNARYLTEQKNKQTKTEKKTFFPDVAILFFNWFSLESVEHSDPALQVINSELCRV